MDGMNLTVEGFLGLYNRSSEAVSRANDLMRLLELCDQAEKIDDLEERLFYLESFQVVVKTLLLRPEAIKQNPADYLGVKNVFSESIFDFERYLVTLEAYALRSAV